MSTDASKLPYLTRSIGGVGGAIKQRPDDFRVDEVPLYEPSGQGDHVYFKVRKTGVPTPVAVTRIARHMGVRRIDIGVAGLKDAQAVTTQMMSLEHADPERLGEYSDSQVQVIWTGRHGNKLKTGHLAGNLFRIRIRDINPADLGRAREILDILARRGVPNYFGQQRFGRRGDTAQLGETIVRGDLQRFVELLLGRPSPDDHPAVRAARDAFDGGYFARALKKWPRPFVDQRKALIAYKRRGDPKAAFRAVDKRMRRLYVSAFQSLLFNEVLARRLEQMDVLADGDWAVKHANGAVFKVEDASVEQPRAEAGEISPTGPIFGSKSKFAGGEWGKVERAVLAAHDIELEQFGNLRPMKCRGSRRATRFLLERPAIESGSDEHGEFFEVRFGAESGCYATVALREMMKND
ncbi:MAG: tRNA pseudouridine(13) synthase TruD [Phycisphaerae bacterium]